MLGGDSQEGSIGGAEYLTKALKRHGVDAEAHLFPRSRIAMTPWRVRMGRVVSGAARYTRFSGKDCVGLAAGRYAIAFALMAAGVKRNERVLLPAYHCGSMVEPAVWLGADVEFYRLENDLSLDREHLEGLLQRGAKAVVATRYFGFPLGMDGVRELCDRYGAVLVEDCGVVPAGRRALDRGLRASALRGGRGLAARVRRGLRSGQHLEVLPGPGRWAGMQQRRAGGVAPGATAGRRSSIARSLSRGGEGAQSRVLGCSEGSAADRG